MNLFHPTPFLPAVIYPLRESGKLSLVERKPGFEIFVRDASIAAHVPLHAFSASLHMLFGRFFGFMKKKMRSIL